MVLTNQLVYLVNIKTMRKIFFKLCVLLKKSELYLPNKCVGSKYHLSTYLKVFCLLFMYGWWIFIEKIVRSVTRLLDKSEQVPGTPSKFTVYLSFLEPQSTAVVTPERSPPINGDHNLDQVDGTPPNQQNTLIQGKDVKNQV